MVELHRKVRMCVTNGTTAGGMEPPEATEQYNTWGGWPAMRGLSRWYEIEVVCKGETDATGYFINVTDIDKAVREETLPYLQDMVSGPCDPAGLPMGEVMRGIINGLQMPLDETVSEIHLHLTPMLTLGIESEHMDRITIRHEYDFSAAHRLHCETMSDQENREVFGKCNNPEGHGHNYVLEVAVSLPIDPMGEIASIEELDKLVDTSVIQKFDHKHLNKDTAEFLSLNPTVENISKVIWEKLAGKVEDLGSMPGAELVEVKLWETKKTHCVYRG